MSGTIEQIAASVAVVITEKLMGKIFELAKGNIKFAFEVKGISFSSFGGSEWGPGLLALVEVTNLSDSPYTISEFFLKVGASKVKNLYIKETSDNIVNTTMLGVSTGNKLRGTFKLDFDFFEPLWRPYLQKNESALGIIVFKLDKEFNGSDLSISARIAGHNTELVADIL